jgi:uncharacterized membrane protein
MILTISRTWMVVLGLALVIGTALWAAATRRRGTWRAGGLAVAWLGAAFLIYSGLCQAGALHETFVRFGSPMSLLGVAAVSVVVGLRVSRLPTTMGRTRRRLVAVFSWMAALAAALVPAEPELGRPLDRLAVLVAIDRSRSIDLVTSADLRIRSELRAAELSMHPDDRIGTLAFGASAAMEDPLRLRGEVAPPQRIEVGRDATDLEAAIRRGLAELPPDAAGRMILMSDGVQNRGDALAGAAAAVAANVPIDVVVLEQKVIPDIRVVAVRAPQHVDVDEAFELRVVTSSAVAADIELRIGQDDGDARVMHAHVAAGEDVLRLRETAHGAGLHRYDVALTANDPTADQAPDDNSGSAFVRVRGESRALVLEGDAGHGGPLRKALEASGFQTAERATTGVPPDVGGFASYDLVVLSDVRASDLSTSQIDALATYARDLGGGLLLMGDDRSMGPGGYARTPVEDVSPVAFDLKQEKRRASLAEVIAIDYSGSMGAMVSGHTKLELANEAAARSASLLGAGDRLGVEHVDTVVRWTVPMSPVNDPHAIGEAIRSVSVGGGGIYTDLALRAGYESLIRESVNLKHLLLFADGSDAEQIVGCREIVKEAYDRGMTTSVISLGRGSDSPELEVLSKVGGGRFYLIEDATKLPAVFTQETILAARSALHEVPFRASPVLPAAPTRGIDLDRQPMLEGYVVTMPKPRASVLLSAPEGDPILATWSVGIGRVGAFMSDYKDRWGHRWLAWPDAAKLFGQLARDLARRADDPRVRLEADTSGGELHVRGDVVGDDGRAQTFRRLVVHVAGPDGFKRDIPLDAIGAGRYGASLPLARPGTYVATAKDEVTGEPVGTTGAALTAGEELRPTGSDAVLLDRIASLTGGRVRDTLAGLFDDRAARRFAYRSLVPSLIILASVAMLLAVASRRAGVSDAWVLTMARVDSWRAARREREAERAAAHVREQALAIREQERLRDVIRSKREQQTRAHPDSGDVPSHPVSLRAPPPVKPTPVATPPAEGGANRPLTAVEMLARKRRERR